MVKCLECKRCFESVSEIDNKRYYGCFLKRKAVLEKSESPEYWALLNTGILETFTKVDPFGENSCPHFRSAEFKRPCWKKRFATIKKKGRSFLRKITVSITHESP